METLSLIRPDDFHVHLREPRQVRETLFHTAQAFGRALVMPNLASPVLTADDATGYHHAIMRAVREFGFPGGFTPLMTIQIVDATTPETIRDAKKAGVTAGKLYPAGVTTNSANGVRQIDALAPVFEEMQRADMVLCLHGETPDIPILDRETHFLMTLGNLASEFPRLRIVLEHLSTAAAVEMVKRLPENVGATITAHHLRLTLDDVIGDTLRPHHFCKPVAKRPEDRLALLKAAMSGNPKFFFGSDSAPHARSAKECAEGCAGVFSAQVALPLLATIFEENGQLGMLEEFVSINGACFYRKPTNPGRTTLVKQPWRVPNEENYGRLPFMAGETLPWKFSY